MRRFISFVIVFSISVQLLAIFFRTGPWIWPFTNYPMYSQAHHENSRINAHYYIYAIFEDGSKQYIDPEHIGVTRPFYVTWAETMNNYPGSQYELGSGGIIVKKEESQLRQTLKSYLSRRKIAGKYIDVFTRAASEAFQKKIVEFHVDDYPAIITRDGWEEAKPALRIKELEIIH